GDPLVLGLAAVLAGQPPVFRQREDLPGELDPRLGTGAQPERRVLRVRVVPGGGPGAGPLDGELADDLRLLLLSRRRGRAEVPDAAHGPGGDLVGLDGRGHVLDRKARLAVAPLPVGALVVDQELGALPDPGLMGDA